MYGIYDTYAYRPPKPPQLIGIYGSPMECIMGDASKLTRQVLQFVSNL